MSQIKIKCPDCEKEIRVNIKTIDTLRAELEYMTKERDRYRAMHTALELKIKSNPLGGIFGF